MRPIALFLAFAAADPSLVELESGTLPVASHDYRYINAPIAHWPATFICRMDVADGDPIALELVSQDDFKRFIRGRPHRFLVSLGPRRSGNFRQALPEKAEYALILINDGEHPSMVRLEAAIQFAREPDVATYLSPRRRLAVISISLAFFLAIVSWATWKLVGAIRGT